MGRWLASFSKPMTVSSPPYWTTHLRHSWLRVHSWRVQSMKVSKLRPIPRRGSQEHPWRCRSCFVYARRCPRACASSRQLHREPCSGSTTRRCDIGRIVCRSSSSTDVLDVLKPTRTHLGICAKCTLASCHTRIWSCNSDVGPHTLDRSWWHAAPTRVYGATSFSMKDSNPPPPD